MLKWWALFFITGIFLETEKSYFIDLQLSVFILHIIYIKFFRQPAYSSCNRRNGLSPGCRFLLTAVTCLFIYSASLTAMGTARMALNGDIAGINHAEEYREDEGNVSFPAAVDIRKHLLKRLREGGLNGRTSNLARAVLLADKSGLDRALKDSYIYLGIAHFLALSGLHLGIVILPVSYILKLAGIKKGKANIVIALFAVLYAAVAGFPPSLLRAASLFLAAIMLRTLNTRSDLTESLLTGSLALAAASPSIVYNTGFQLSFLAVAGIFLLGLPIIDSIKSVLPRGKTGKAISYIITPLVITVSVNIFLLPMILNVYGRCSLISPVVNLIIILPFTAFVYSACVYLLLPVTFISSAAAGVLNIIARFLYDIPSAISSRYYPALYSDDLETAIYIISVILIVIGLKRRFGMKKFITAAGILLGAFSLILPRVNVDEVENSVSVNSFFGIREIEQRCRYSSAAGGILTLRKGLSRYMARRYIEELYRRGIGRVENIVICSSGLSRTGGVVYLINRMGAERVICSRYLYGSEGARLKNALDSKIELKAVSSGDGVNIRDGVLKILSPEFPPESGDAVDYENSNLSYILIINN